jgi:hypothetical protein
MIMQTPEDIEQIRRTKARRIRIEAKCKRDPDVKDLMRRVENLTEENRILRERLNTLDDPAAADVEAKASEPTRGPGRPRKA